jgi:hypothetical protein
MLPFEDVHYFINRAKVADDLLTLPVLRRAKCLEEVELGSEVLDLLVSCADDTGVVEASLLNDVGACFAEGVEVAVVPPRVW